MLLKLSDLSLELNLSLEWSTNAWGVRERRGELSSLFFEGATEREENCSVCCEEEKGRAERHLIPSVPRPLGCPHLLCMP